MKTVLIIALILGNHITAFSQKIAYNGNREETFKPLNLSVSGVDTNTEKKTSFYLTDKNRDLSIEKLESDFISYNLGKDYVGYDSYSVTFQVKKGSLTATYSSTGKLINVTENYSNTELPNKISCSVYKAYPGWQIVSSKHAYIQEDGSITKNEYDLKLKKGNKTLKLKVEPTGEIINLDKKNEFIAKI
jgi:hypothetical protein